MSSAETTPTGGVPLDTIRGLNMDASVYLAEQVKEVREETTRERRESAGFRKAIKLEFDEFKSDCLSEFGAISAKLDKLSKAKSPGWIVASLAAIAAGVGPYVPETAERITRALLGAP